MARKKNMVVLSAGIQQDVVYNSKTYRLIYNGLDSQGLPRFVYYTTLGWQTISLQSKPPPTERACIEDITSTPYQCGAGGGQKIDVTFADSFNMIFDFVSCIQPAAALTVG